MTEMDLDCPPSFPFPFPPYDVQLDFMKNLYVTLQENKIGIFESPTGTGKSLSLICGALHWLKNHQLKRKEYLQKELLSASEIHQDDSDDWFSSHTKRKEQDEILQKVKIEYEFMTKQDEKIKKLKSINKRKRVESDEDSTFNDLFRHAKQVKEAVENELKLDLLNTNASDQEFILDDYISDKEEEDNDESVSNEEERHVLKIFYCSRTHSQLSQFIHEVQRSPFKDSVRVVVLGSRQNLCINDTVLKLKSLRLMNEVCRDLQANKKVKSLNEVLNVKNQHMKQSKSRTACPFFSQKNMSEMSDSILINIQDIEQTVQLGKKTKACPYYSTRYSIPEAELVVLPYNILLNKQARNASGIKISGNIILIDEAHNLLEVINNIHSAEITGSHLSHTYSQLKQYQQRYYARLNPKNLMYIKQILFILSSLIKHLGGSVETLPKAKLSSDSHTTMFTHGDFLSAAGIDNINLFKILKYCEQSKIGQKLHGFVDKNQVSLNIKSSVASLKKSSIVCFHDKANSGQNKPNNVQEPKDDDYLSSPFIIFQEFIRTLTNPSHDGRILSNHQDTLQNSYLKFLLLNPSMQFQEIVKEARSIIIAGGTMQPISEFIDQLFLPAGVNKDRIVHFSCGHVIPPDNLLTVVLTHGPAGKVLDFTFQHRNNPETIEELGRVLFNLCTIVPGGMVCFFPSYDYEQQVYSQWEKSGVINRLSKKKKIFREPKKSNQVDKILGEYAKCIALAKENKNNHNGALLLSIVGGKMSEGINFSDDLGRCVVMIGLPYANVNSPELKEKIEYLNKTAKGTSQKTAGQIYYENICMKAVNQSIGRAIRHKQDHATIVLLDCRYQRQAVHTALPAWIISTLKVFQQFGSAFSAICQFFNGKKVKTETI